MAAIQAGWAHCSPFQCAEAKALLGQCNRKDQMRSAPAAIPLNRAPLKAAICHALQQLSTKQALLPDSPLRANAGTALLARGKVGGPVLTRLYVAAAFQPPQQPPEPVECPVEQPQTLLLRHSLFCPNITYPCSWWHFHRAPEGSPTVSKRMAEGAQDMSLFLFSR